MGMVPVRQFGANKMKFIHSTNHTVLHTSTKCDDAVRLLSLNEQKYVRYFHGHTGKVAHLSVTHTQDLFLSSGEDATVRLWDIRVPDCLGVLRAKQRCLGAMDPGGLVFAMAAAEQGLLPPAVLMYDARQFEKGPFESFPLPMVPGDWTGLRFSPNGKLLALSHAAGRCTLLDSFTGAVVATPLIYTSSGDDIEMAFTPCSGFLAAGSPEGPVRLVPAAASATPPPVAANAPLLGPAPVPAGGEVEAVAVLPGHHDTTACVLFNPQFSMMASACRVLSLWLPREL
eukprot:m.236790 g.236790  ORF g.236790 m.236790 type:complete len:285 (-) comp20777_c0_seq1:467-1321(-)